MLFEDVMQYFKNFHQLAKAMNRDPQSFYYWKHRKLIPMKAQIFLEVFTKGALKADKEHAKQRTVIRKYKTRKDKGIPKGPLAMQRKPSKPRIVPSEIIDSNLNTIAKAIGKVISA